MTAQLVPLGAATRSPKAKTGVAARTKRKSRTALWIWGFMTPTIILYGLYTGSSQTTV